MMGHGKTATILACITCEAMLLITDIDQDVIEHPQNYLCNAAVIFAPIVCKTCDVNYKNKQEQSSRTVDVAVNFNLIMMWEPYTAANAYTEGALVINKTVCQMVDRHAVQEHTARGKLMRTVTIADASDEPLEVKPYLVSGFL